MLGYPSFFKTVGWGLGLSLFLGISGRFTEPSEHTEAQAGGGHVHTTMPHNIPAFFLDPSRTHIRTIKSGDWSDPSVWSTGAAPTSHQVAHIDAGFKVTVDNADAAAYTVAVRGTLTFQTDVKTILRVSNLMVLPEGTLEVGTASSPILPDVTAEIVIADTPLDTADDGLGMFDPEQFGNGLLGLGHVTMHGAALSETFVRLAAEPKTGITTLTLNKSVSGWKAGDRILIPDSRQKTNSITANSFSEERTIQSLSGTTITLNSPLRHDHPGAYDVGATENTVLPNGEKLLPHVVNLSRNIIVRSENPAGVRGHTMLSHMATVDIRYAQFKDLGRTTIAALDNTTFDAEGNVAQIGTNQIGRYSLHAHHLHGPTATPSNGYQFTLQGNNIEDTQKWGIVIHATHFGLVKDNVVHRALGAGIFTEDGSESFNVIERNFVANVKGDDEFKVGRAADGFWFRGPNNYVRNNVVAGPGFFGFVYFMQDNGRNRNREIPSFKGADTSAPSQSTARHINKMPILEFTGNEVYHSAGGGLNIWNLGVSESDINKLPESLVKDFRIWHYYSHGIFGYNADRLTVDGLIIRGDVRNMSPKTSLRSQTARGSGFTNVRQSRLNTIRNSDIQGILNGLRMPDDFGPNPIDTTFLVENTYLRNYQNFYMTMPLDESKAPLGRKVILKNVKFAALPFTTDRDGPQLNIWTTTNLATKSGNFILPNDIYVYSYNGVAGDDFRVYFLEQAPDVVVPQTNTRAKLVGSPEAGLTNRQNLATYGIAIGGGIAGCLDERDGIIGFVCPTDEVFVPPLPVPAPALRRHVHPPLQRSPQRRPGVGSAFYPAPGFRTMDARRRTSTTHEGDGRPTTEGSCPKALVSLPQFPAWSCAPLHGQWPLAPPTGTSRAWAASKQLNKSLRIE